MKKKCFNLAVVALSLCLIASSLSGCSNEAHEEEIKKEAYNSGYDAGYEKGKEEGRNEGREEVYSELEQISDMAWNAEDLIDAYYDGSLTIYQIAEMYEEMGSVAYRITHQDDVDLYFYLTGEHAK